VKVKYICDCCDSIFEELDFPDGELLEGLTANTGRDIILEDAQGSTLIVTATCDECSATLGIDDEDEFVFYRPPIIN